MELKESPAAPGALQSPANGQKTTKTTRGSNFDDEEIDQLCRSWIYVSQNCITTNGQKSDIFWQSLATHFNHYRPDLSEVLNKALIRIKVEHRSESCFQVYWLYFWCSQYGWKRHFRRWRYRKSLKIFKSTIGTSFSLMTAYRILSVAPKWQSIRDTSWIEPKSFHTATPNGSKDERCRTRRQRRPGPRTKTAGREDRGKRVRRQRRRGVRRLGGGCASLSIKIRGGVL